MAKKTCENMLTNDIKCHRELRYVIGHRVEDNMGENGDRPARKTGGLAALANFVVQPLKWLQVCGTCDRQIGRKNLMRLGWSLQEAIQWEREPDMNPPRHPTRYGQQEGRGARPAHAFRSRAPTSTTSRRPPVSTGNTYGRYW